MESHRHEENEDEEEEEKESGGERLVGREEWDKMGWDRMGWDRMARIDGQTVARSPTEPLCCDNSVVSVPGSGITISS